MADRQRLLELALKGLQAEREQIDKEIATIRREAYGQRGRSVVEMPRSRRKKRRLSAKQRKALSERMKAFWAKRKAKEAKKR